MVFLVTGILAYYLALVASLTIRSRHAEIAMLKSRGATTWQIGLLVLVEGLLLAVPALIVGTLLAPVVGRILGELFFTVSGDAATRCSPERRSFGIATFICPGSLGARMFGEDGEAARRRP